MILHSLNALPQSEFGVAGRIVLLCIIISLAGRALVAFFFAPAEHDTERNSGYFAVASGPVVLLFLTWVLRQFHVYNFDNVVAALLAIETLAFVASADFRSAFGGWRRSSSIVWFMYIGAVLAFWILLSPEEYDLRGTSLYLIQGFDLFLDQNPGTFPLYGKMIIAPLLYAGHTVSSTFALFSYGDHFLYYSYGEYWLNLIIGPLIPIGAYLFFKRFLPRWLSILTALLFCLVVLDYKVWQLRGESLAWIPGFAFLILLVDFLSALRRFPSTIWVARYVAGMALMFFALSLTHGVTTLIVFFLSVGITFSCVLAEHSLKGIGRLVGSILLFGAFAGFVYSGFAATYSRNGIVEDYSPAASGQPDAAMEYDNATRNLPLETDARYILPHPPYISRLNVIGMSTLLPPASLFHRGISFFRIRDFPAVPIHSLYYELAWPEYYLYPGLLVGCCIFFMLFPSSVSLRVQALFWAAAATYLLIPVLALYLDSKSVGVFPIVAVRRTYPYSSLFYWMGLIIGVTAIVSGVLKNRVYRANNAVVKLRSRPSTSHRIAMVSSILEHSFSKQMQRNTKSESWTRLGGVDLIVLWMAISAELMMLTGNFARKTAENIWGLWHELSMLPRKSIGNLSAAERYGLLLLIPLHAALRSWRVIFVCLVPLWFVYSINKDQDRPFSVSWFSNRVGYRLLQMAPPSSANPPISVALKPLFDAVAFIRDRTSVGELVYSNLLSEDLFWFLSSGRVSLLDGTSIYQLYLLQKESARRIRQFADFAITANMEDVEGFNFKYLLLYKGAVCGKVCYGDQIFLADLGRFDDDPRFKRVFENSAYVVFERMNVAAGSVARSVTSTSTVEASGNSQNGGLGR